MRMPIQHFLFHHFDLYSYSIQWGNVLNNSFDFSVCQWIGNSVGVKIIKWRYLLYAIKQWNGCYILSVWGSNHLRNLSNLQSWLNVRNQKPYCLLFLGNHTTPYDSAWVFSKELPLHQHPHIPSKDRRKYSVPERRKLERDMGNLTRKSLIALDSGKSVQDFYA